MILILFHIYWIKHGTSTIYLMSDLINKSVVFLQYYLWLLSLCLKQAIVLLFHSVESVVKQQTKKNTLVLMMKCIFICFISFLSSQFMVHQFLFEYAT